MNTNKGYITGFNLVSDYAAIQLKLNHIQVVILNLFIINMLADKLEKFDEDNPTNILYRFNVYYWADYFGISKQYFKRNLIALTKVIKCVDGTEIQVMFCNKRRGEFYVGMTLQMMHWLVNKDFYNTQCIHHKKPELCYFINKIGEETDNRENEMQKTNNANNSFVPVQLVGGMKPVFEIEDKTNNGYGKKHFSNWSEGIVKRICEMAVDGNVQLIKNGKAVNIFPHLKDGEFRQNRRKHIDDACRIVDDLYSGRFFREYKRHEIFGTINKDHLRLKNVDTAVDRLLFLIKNKNKDGIERFLYRCTKNYFDALKPGMETYYFIKSSFPVNIKSFLLHRNIDGTYTANFLMYYFSTLSSKDMKLNIIIDKVKKMVPSSVFDKLLEYEDYLLEKHIQPFWQKVYELSKEIKSIINSEETSYSMASCFDIVFKKVNKVSEDYKKVLPGYFDIEQQTASDALIEMRDK